MPNEQANVGTNAPQNAGKIELKNVRRVALIVYVEEDDAETAERELEYWLNRGAVGVHVGAYDLTISTPTDDDMLGRTAMEFFNELRG